MVNVINGQFKDVYAMRNSVMAYQWGAQNGISTRLNLPKTYQPEAELWIGAHPKAPSEFAQEMPCNITNLAEYERITEQKLPYLLKYLAVNEPLSIQTHPTKQQAEHGFAAENAAGIPIDAPHRNYRDPNPKPELIIALETGFEALCGFRDVTASAGQMCAYAVHTSVANATALHGFAGRLKNRGLIETVSWILTESTETAEEKNTLLLSLQTASASVVAAPDVAPDLAQNALLLQRLFAQYDSDPGILVAALLQHIKLAPGQALWLKPGTPHSYIGGHGIEIMGPSDNVLRGGLTPKHIDTAELLQTLDFDSSATQIFTPYTVGGMRRFQPDPDGVHSEPFELVQTLGDCVLMTATPMCVLVTDGSFTAGSGHSTKPVTATTGESLLLPAGTVKLEGKGQAFIACGQLLHAAPLGSNFFIAADPDICPAGFSEQSSAVCPAGYTSDNASQADYEAAHGKNAPYALKTQNEAVETCPVTGDSQTQAQQ
ncbi:MAG: mannose-6-phosphate isomerase, class I [Microbacteriaceae bacterium]|nr:mannose-6-phosphate isomerase, class I [Microbacteriaceae bacterium]